MRNTIWQPPISCQVKGSLKVSLRASAQAKAVTPFSGCLNT
ncbi:hypothetical protein [Kingella oralis]|nr:hypothetical protein [Kingella oralis]